MDRKCQFNGSEGGPARLHHCLPPLHFLIGAAHIQFVFPECRLDLAGAASEIKGGASMETACAVGGIWQQIP